MSRLLGWKGTQEGLERGLSDLASPVYYPVICAWCNQRIPERWTTVEYSHGICPKCEEKLTED